MEDAITIENRGDFGQWAIEVAKQIVSEHGFELARSARDGSEDDVRVALRLLLPARGVQRYIQHKIRMGSRELRQHWREATRPAYRGGATRPRA